MKRKASFRGFVSAVAVFASSIQASADPSDGQYGHMMDGAYGGGMVFGGLFMLLLLVGLIVAILAAVRWIARDGSLTGSGGDAALKTLNMRFANGEIDAAEFAERKKLLVG